MKSRSAFTSAQAESMTTAHYINELHFNYLVGNLRQRNCTSTMDMVSGVKAQCYIILAISVPFFAIHSIVKRASYNYKRKRSMPLCDIVAMSMTGFLFSGFSSK